MLLNTNVALAVRCHVCGELEVYDLPLFEVRKNNSKELTCGCGQSKLTFKKEKDFYCIQMDCFACGDTHVFKYTLRQLLEGNLVNHCIDGKEVCFIGKNEDISQLIDTYEKQSEKILSELQFYDYFENVDVMTETIHKLRELYQEKSIVCECEHDAIDMEIFPDRVELKCGHCNSVKMIYAQDEKELENLLEKDYIIMHKQALEYIDAMNGSWPSADTYQITDY